LEAVRWTKFSVEPDILVVIDVKSAALEYVSLPLYQSEGLEGSDGSDVLIGSDADAKTESVHIDKAVALGYARNLPTLEYFDIDGNQWVIHTRFWHVIQKRG
jgi:hypothetical protein